MSLRLDPGAQARALLHLILQHGDLAGQDAAGRTLITLAVDTWTLDQLLSFDAGSEDLEDADAEPSAADEEDGPPVVVDLLRPRTVTRRRPWRRAAPTEPMARRATIQLKVHRQIVQSIPLDDADIECLIQGLQLVRPCTQRIDA